jgi:outer membrane protein insertion porin family
MRSIMKRPSILLVLALAAAASWAQSGAGTAPDAAADWFWGKPLASVQWEGVVHADKRELDSVLRVYLGRPFTEELWMELQSRLYELDWFEKIDPVALPADEGRTRVSVQFTVVERPSVDSVLVVGNSGLRSTEVLDVVTIKGGEIYNAAKARVDELAVRRLYLERGFPDAAIKAGTEPGLSPNTVDVVFTVNEGTQVAVRQIIFSGNTAVATQTLKGQMSLKEYGLFQPGAFQESKLEDDKRAIVDYYKSRGYVDAAIVDVVRSFEKDAKTGRSWLILDLALKEGRQWLYEGVTFQGNEIFPSSKLGDLIYQRPGGILNYRKLLQDKQRIDDLYYESGYIFNAIELGEKRDEEKGSIAYTIKITERDRAHIESIAFKGNKKTKDYVLYRELPLEVGDIFSKAKIVEGLRNLYNLQYFSAVEPEMFPGSADNLMKLQIGVEEQSTADIQFGVTLSGLGQPDTFPVSGLIKWNDRNFLGNGQDFSLELNASPDTQTVTLGFSDNWLFGKRLAGGASLSFAHKLVSAAQDSAAPFFDDGVPDPYTEPLQWTGSTATIPSAYLMPYQSWDVALGFNGGYSFHSQAGDVGFGGGISFGLGSKNYDAGKYRPASRDLRESNGIWKLNNKLLARAYLNNLDFWYSPGKGYYASQRFTLAGILPFESQHYIKSDTKLEGYLTLFNVPVVEGWNFKWILGAHSGFSALLPEPGYGFSVSDDWLAIDGTFNARGWNNLFGMDGKTLWENWVELRMPLFESFLWADGFFDAAALQTATGMVDMNPPANANPVEDPAKPNFGHLGWENMAFSLGFGFRFTIPQFPFRFYFAKRFTFDGRNIQWKTTGPDFVISITQPLN